jgi:hypothetical protein
MTLLKMRLGTLGKASKRVIYHLCIPSSASKNLWYSKALSTWLTKILCRTTCKKKYEYNVTFKKSLKTSLCLQFVLITNNGTNPHEFLWQDKLYSNLHSKSSNSTPNPFYSWYIDIITQMSLFIFTSFHIVLKKLKKIIS